MTWFNRAIFGKIYFLSKTDIFEVSKQPTRQTSINHVNYWLIRIQIPGRLQCTIGMMVILITSCPFISFLACRLPIVSSDSKNDWMKFEIMLRYFKKYSEIGDRVLVIDDALVAVWSVMINKNFDSRLIINVWHVITIIMINSSSWRLVLPPSSHLQHHHLKIKSEEPLLRVHL